MLFAFSRHHRHRLQRTHLVTARNSRLLALSIVAIIVGVSAGPVQIRVEQDNNKSFHVGPEARTTFELVEQYTPLSTAFNSQSRPRAFASSLSKGPPLKHVSSPAQILVDFGSGINNSGSTAGGVDDGPNDDPTRPRLLGRNGDRVNSLNDMSAHVRNTNVQAPKKSEWLEWTKWSPCGNGERIRIRQCLEVNNVKCEGPSVLRQNCFHFQSQVPVAKDPLVIEKEILGVDPNQPIRRT